MWDCIETLGYSSNFLYFSILANLAVCTQLSEFGEASGCLYNATREPRSVNGRNKSDESCSVNTKNVVFSG